MQRSIEYSNTSINIGVTCWRDFYFNLLMTSASCIVGMPF